MMVKDEHDIFTDHNGGSGVVVAVVQTKMFGSFINDFELLIRFILLCNLLKEYSDNNFYLQTFVLSFPYIFTCINF